MRSATTLAPMRLLTVVGNRPQFVKAAPLSVALREAGIDEVVVHTGQHWDDELSQVFFEELGLPEPAHRLDLRTADVDALTRPLGRVVEAERPDVVLVLGDTSSTLAGARAAAAAGIPLAHCEAATCLCPRSPLGSRSTGTPYGSPDPTSARRRRSRTKASPAARSSSAT